jgi:protein-tyrosine sulfotransferase
MARGCGRRLGSPLSRRHSAEMNATVGDQVDGHRAEPIFIHGILPRSGTNFIWDLLLLHPDCSRGREPVNEDLFLEHSEHLTAFATAVQRAWDPGWGAFAVDIGNRLSESIGDGLISFLWTDRTRRLVTKSPTVRHLNEFFAFFPSARLLILVRDGRSVVQSAMDTFGWDFDRACRAWSEAARTIRQFQQTQSARADRWRVIRYEDFVDDIEAQLRAVFEFLRLDAERYDFVAARNLPVRGSSAFGLHDGKVHWEVVPKDNTFTPKERWRSWSAAQRERFDWLAGEQLLDFGYTTSTRRFGLLDSARHTAGDWAAAARNTARRVLNRTRRVSHLP